MPNEEELAEEVADPFSPPPSTTTGVSLWLAAPRSGHIASLDEETRESLKALGYLR